MSSVIEERYNDVLICRSKAVKTHPGNLFFRKLVKMTQDEYNSGIDRNRDYMDDGKRSQMSINKNIVELVVAAGGRFLYRKSKKHPWQLATNTQRSGKITTVRKELMEKKKKEATMTRTQVLVPKPLPEEPTTLNPGPEPRSGQASSNPTCDSSTEKRSSSDTTPTCDLPLVAISYATAARCEVSTPSPKLEPELVGHSVLLGNQARDYRMNPQSPSIRSVTKLKPALKCDDDPQGHGMASVKTGGTTSTFSRDGATPRNGEAWSCSGCGYRNLGNEFSGCAVCGSKRQRYSNDDEMTFDLSLSSGKTSFFGSISRGDSIHLCGKSVDLSFPLDANQGKISSVASPVVDFETLRLKCDDDASMIHTVDSRRWAREVFSEAESMVWSDKLPLRDGRYSAGTNKPTLCELDNKCLVETKLSDKGMIRRPPSAIQGGTDLSLSDLQQDADHQDDSPKKSSSSAEVLDSVRQLLREIEDSRLDEERLVRLSGDVAGILWNETCTREHSIGLNELKSFCDEVLVVSLLFLLPTRRSAKIKRNALSIIEHLMCLMDNETLFKIRLRDLEGESIVLETFESFENEFKMQSILYASLKKGPTLDSLLDNNDRASAEPLLDEDPSAPIIQNEAAVGIESRQWTTLVNASEPACSDVHLGKRQLASQPEHPGRSSLDPTIYRSGTLPVCFEATDVLICRNYGNKRLRRLLEQRLLPFYATTDYDTTDYDDSKWSKIDLRKEVPDCVKRSGGRFLKLLDKTTGSCKQLSDKEALDRIASEFGKERRNMFMTDIPLVAARPTDPQETPFLDMVTFLVMVLATMHTTLTDDDISFSTNSFKPDGTHDDDNDDQLIFGNVGVSSTEGARKDPAYESSLLLFLPTPTTKRTIGAIDRIEEMDMKQAPRSVLSPKDDKRENRIMKKIEKGPRRSDSISNRQPTHFPQMKAPRRN